MIHEELNSLKKKLVEFASLAEDMVRASIKGLLEKDAPLLKKIIEKDEPYANSLELALDQHCIAAIARYQPRAKDLREVLMIFKINSDLERIADYAVNISDSALFLIERPMVKPLVDIPKMAGIVMKMASDSVTAFINEDSSLAKDVCSRDDLADELRTRIIVDLTKFMVDSPSIVERAMHLIRISGALERIADLSTNISEDVVFIVDGEVFKHLKNNP
jgi:phosphate transport system protein